MYICHATQHRLTDCNAVAPAKMRYTRSDCHNVNGDAIHIHDMVALEHL